MECSFGDDKSFAYDRRALFTKLLSFRSVRISLKGSYHRLSNKFYQYIYIYIILEELKLLDL